jgi:hypothetical protein
MFKYDRSQEDPALPHDVGQIASLTPFHHQTFHHPLPPPTLTSTPPMAPIRRYLRITKYSVLEVRIYLDNPALANSWLLNTRTAVLPRVIEAVRPLVLPKLREENENAAGKKKGKKRGVRDVVAGGEFCLLFLFFL